MYMDWRYLLLPIPMYYPLLIHYPLNYHHTQSSYKRDERLGRFCLCCAEAKLFDPVNHRRIYL